MEFLHAPILWKGSGTTNQQPFIYETVFIIVVHQEIVQNLNSCLVGHW